MNLQSSYISFNNSMFHYQRYGEGEKTLFCFHGYGEHSGSFHLLEPWLGKEFTVISIDLPWHGQTKYEETHAFTPGELKELMTAILATQGRPLQNLYLAGYSLGGRVCLSLMELMPEKIKKMILIAPDGLKVNNWYWFATQTSLGAAIFRGTMRWPGWFLFFLNLSDKMGMANRSVVKFTWGYLHNAPARKKLYERWMVMRRFKPDLRHAKKLMLENGIRVELIFGEHDRIILPVLGEKFRKGVEANTGITLLNTGHQLLQEKFMDVIAHRILPGDET